MDLYLYNSLTKKKEPFGSAQGRPIKLYTCGPTVYDYAHIGHGRKFLMDDILRRTLEFNGYKVNHVQNVTDVGHLVSDADDGEDKLEKGAKKQGKTVWEVAEYFTKSFYESMDALNFLRPTIICKATDHIKEQIKLIEKLFENGYAYDTEEAVYFNVSKFTDYGKMLGQKISEKRIAVRDEVKTDPNKRNNADFALWFKRVGSFVNHTMHWESPWGDGFPGWHIECSAMSMKYLGEQIDIHTGGEDHLSIHHPNEIAQSEGATGKKPFSKFWIHSAFLTVDGTKMSKSLGNFYTISDIVKRGFDPLALRYLYLGAHYKKPMNFTWQALDGASKGLKRLQQTVYSLQTTARTILSEEKNNKILEFRDKFNQAINDDLNTSKAMAVMFEVLKSNIPSRDKYDLAVSFDEVLGLNLK
ncbi:cysteine--tRNA ligase [Candidatus Woesebacteria bacterium GWC2_33_12]|uniref:Cysteine--tRNA ligase n=1 Tax=Candidatus Woesebacteria bacterium GW2011_GWB1_33_22 TaxID=1618566 RepID=A0A0G0C2B0_9BACT|nr:MAG: Cysteine-tRNA ligase [Candidatus Woesebacteria bacterium GW2011_GWC2_33_12]KKP42552.1 MAG: Cysteine-tRNA ligase [Candidatus Woesebacteria bacterium GW2011_GWA2_33_20]KKP45295.1 MAG: Cysteine-tRNA ligase [Candidatus Woesebacteria bacterium GW2011_GWB1_33_22]KKP47123.1 MAG: Cysteine-tRNA ligase [Microgenomates group bacterium GW2011_GWC1_33_28]KKP50965.1 MAG: Cysteine-tRNA ligase [Candidatus Woesebacteria bacterium GW2011_GWA1_33_33]OGM07185.1 MAG: cysteine--tRNA ligase [Candidatus Woese